jgi:hypothetical protein
MLSFSEDCIVYIYLLHNTTLNGLQGFTDGSKFCVITEKVTLL